MRLCGVWACVLIGAAVVVALPVQNDGAIELDQEVARAPASPSQVPVRGKGEAAANKAAVKIEKDEKKKAEAEKAARAIQASKLSEKERTMSMKDIDTAMKTMTKDERPIDVLASKYKSLKYKPSSTPKSVLKAQVHAQRVATMEKTMKEKVRNKQVPTLAGMAVAIKTTINANMKQALSGMPYKASQKWSDVLPTETIVKKWEAGKVNSKAPPKKQSAADAKQDEMEKKAEEEMLTKRQNAVSKQEQKLAAEKVVAQKKLAKLAGAANNFQTKVITREEGIQADAQKKMHAAMIALNAALKDKYMAHKQKIMEAAKVKKLHKALELSILRDLQLKNSTKARVSEIKHSMSVAEQTTVQRLQKASRTKLTAMLRSAQIVAQKELKSKDKLKDADAKIKTLQSKVTLQRREDERSAKQLKTKVTRKETHLWRNKVKATRKRLMKENMKVEMRLLKAQTQEAVVAHGALKSQQLLQKMKLPLQAKKLANRLRGRDSKEVKKLTVKNTKLATALSTAKQELEDYKKKSIKQGVALGLRNKAFGRLVHLVKNVETDRQKAERNVEVVRVEAEQQAETMKNAHAHSMKKLELQNDKLKIGMQRAARAAKKLKAMAKAAPRPKSSAGAAAKQ